MSRIASVKETGEELSPAEWRRFEEAVAAELQERVSDEPYARNSEAREPKRLDAERRPS